MLSYNVLDYAVLNGRDGVTTYAKHQNADGSYLSAHLPVNGTTLRTAAISFGQQREWTHVATLHHADSTESHRMFYRFAHPDDLGRPNNGQEHHLRVQSASLPHPGSNSLKMRDLIKDVDGVIGEYLYEENDKAPWNDLHDACKGTYMNQCGLGASLANNLETQQVEAGCAVPGVAGRSSNSYTGLNKGVFAYGWNNKPFDFQGRAGGWLDGCGTPARSCSPE